MPKFTNKNIEFKDGQKAIFGDNDDSSISWDNNNAELTITTVVSGVDPTDPGHLITKRYLDNELATVSGGIVQDHGQLTGLSDDDHSQYLLADGTRPLSGDWNFGSYSVSGTGNYYGNGATLSGVAYVDGDDVYFYDTTRSKTLGVAIIEVGCGRNSANTTNQYLRTFNGTPMNQTGIALPFDATLIGGSMSGSVNTQSWTAIVRKNGSSTNLASLPITNAYENHVFNADVNFDEGDRIQVYLQGTNINYPQVRLYFRRRK